MHKVLVNRLGGLSLPRNSVVRLTDRPDMTLDVYRGRKTTIQYNTLMARLPWQCSAEKFHNWGQCPRALEKVGTFEKKAGTLCEK